MPAVVDAPRFIRQIRTQWLTIREGVFRDLGMSRIALEQSFEAVGAAYHGWLTALREGFRDSVCARLAELKKLSGSARASNLPGFEYAGNSYLSSWLDVFVDTGTDPLELAPRTWGKLLAHIDSECLGPLQQFVENCWSVPLMLAIDPLSEGICAFSFHSDGYTDRETGEEVPAEPGWEALQEAARCEWRVSAADSDVLVPLLARARDELCESPFYWALALDRLVAPSTFLQFLRDRWFIEELRSPFAGWADTRQRPRPILDGVSTPAVFLTIIKGREPIPENLSVMCRLAVAVAFLLDRLEAVEPALAPEGNGLVVAEAPGCEASTLRVTSWDLAPNGEPQGAQIEGHPQLSDAEAVALHAAMTNPARFVWCTRSVAKGLNKRLQQDVLLTSRSAGELAAGFNKPKTNGGESVHWLVADVEDSTGTTSQATNRST
ncbi:MAG: hypothetical protein AB7K09_02475 [Planctomycetota bacterium]